MSWDDLAIVKWEWTREQNSLAAGIIILNTDHSPVLIVCIFYGFIIYLWTSIEFE